MPSEYPAYARPELEDFLGEGARPAGREAAPDPQMLATPSRW